MSSINLKLDHWINNNLNVCFVGRHGVGKTAMIKSAFERHNLIWRYFSASTMDPWTDFVGVPKEKTENQLPDQFNIIKELSKIDKVLAQQWVVNNWHMPEDKAIEIVNYTINHQEGKTYLDFVRPRFLGGDNRGSTIPNEEVEALFFDEYNRSTKKIRNSVMELIQFKSVNGYRFPKLRFVWIAINPDEEEQIHYDVEQMDAAQADRFHITIKIPYRPDVEWFRSQYGQRMADSAISWWDELDEDNKRRISPRRLQYALDCAKSKGDLHDILPPSSNVSKLIANLKDGRIMEKLEELIKNNDPELTKKFLLIENNCTAAMKYIPKSEKMMSFFLPHMPKEKIVSLMDDSSEILDHVVYNLNKQPVFKNVCKNILEANKNPKVCRKIKMALTEDENLSIAFHNENLLVEKNPDEPYFNKKASNTDYIYNITKLESMPIHTEVQRMNIYKSIETTIPQKISTFESIRTLSLLGSIFNKNDELKNETEKNKWKFASIVAQPNFSKLCGIINTCLKQIKSDNSFMIQNEINKEEIKQLFNKLIQSGLSTRLLEVPNAN